MNLNLLQKTLDFRETGLKRLNISVGVAKVSCCQSRGMTKNQPYGRIIRSKVDPIYFQPRKNYTQRSAGKANTSTGTMGGGAPAEKRSRGSNRIYRWIKSDTHLTERRFRVVCRRVRSTSVTNDTQHDHTLGGGPGSYLHSMP